MFPVLAEATSINFVENVGTLVTIMGVFLGGVVSLMAMIGKVRSDIESIRIELQKDRQYMESRITQLEQQVHKIRNQLTSILLTLAKSKIPVDSTDLDDK
jgi:hypothetical protein